MGEFFILYISNVDRSIYAHEFGRLRSSEEGHSEELRPLQRFKAIYCTITAKKKSLPWGRKPLLLPLAPCRTHSAREAKHVTSRGPGNLPCLKISSFPTCHGACHAIFSQPLLWREGPPPCYYYNLSLALCFSMCRIRFLEDSWYQGCRDRE